MWQRLKYSQIMLYGIVYSMKFICFSSFPWVFQKWYNHGGKKLNWHVIFFNMHISPIYKWISSGNFLLLKYILIIFIVYPIIDSFNWNISICGTHIMWGCLYSWKQEMNSQLEDREVIIAVQDWLAYYLE